MTLKQKIMLLAFLLASIVLSSCMVEQRITLAPDHSGVWTLEGEAMSFTASSLNNLALLGGYNDVTALYDETVRNSRQSLGKRNDINSYQISRKGDQGWEADIGFKDIESLLGSTQEEGIAELRSSTGSSTLSLRFDREKASQLEKLIPMMGGPAFSLFNPALIGNIGEETYITDILGFSFGEENIPAIRRASIGLTISLPGDVTSVSGGIQTGKRTARFKIPFTRFLVLDKEIFWSVTWEE